MKSIFHSTTKEIDIIS